MNGYRIFPNVTLSINNPTCCGVGAAYCIMILLNANSVLLAAQGGSNHPLIIGIYCNRQFHPPSEYKLYVLREEKPSGCKTCGTSCCVTTVY